MASSPPLIDAYSVRTTWRLQWFALALFCFFWNLGAVPLFDVDEGAFSEATREMLARGDFITTYLNGNLRFDKPILIYWFQAAAVSVLGVNEWSFRLPSAIAATAWLMTIVMFARRVIDQRSALFAMAFAGLALGPLVIGRAATADALLHLCLAATLLEICRYSTNGARPHVVTAFFWMGLGMLTKGPVAIAIPFLTTLAFIASTVWLSRHGKDNGRAINGYIRQWLRAAFDPAGWLILLAVAGPWYALELHEQGQAFIAGFFMKHNVDRFTSTMQGHGGHLLYYVPALLLVLLPFSGLFIRILPLMKGQWRDPLDRFLWIWFGTVYVIFSLSQTQLPHYILYGATPLFLLMARHRHVLRSYWLAYGPAIIFLTVLLFLPEIIDAARKAAKSVYIVDMLALTPAIFDWSYRAGVLFALIVVCLLSVTVQGDRSVSLVLTGFVQTVVIVGLLLPRLADLQQGPVKSAALFSIMRSEPVVAWGINAPSFSVYRNAVTPVRRPTPGELVLTRSDSQSQLPPGDIIFEQGGVLLIKIKDSH